MSKWQQARDRFNGLTDGQSKTVMGLWIPALEYIGTGEYYDRCADNLNAAIDKVLGVKVKAGLEVQADEYDEAIRAQEILENLER